MRIAFPLPPAALGLLVGACIAAPADTDSTNYCAPDWNGGPRSATPLPTDPANPHARLVSLTFDADNPHGLKLVADVLLDRGVPATFFVKPSISWKEHPVLATLQGNPQLLVAPALEWDPSPEQLQQCRQKAWCGEEAYDGLKPADCHNITDAEAAVLKEPTKSWCLGSQLANNRDTTIGQLRADLDEKRAILGRLGILQPASAVLYRHPFGARGGEAGDCYIEADGPANQTEAVLGSSAVRWHIDGNRLIAGSDPGGDLQNALDYLVRNEPQDTWKKDKAIVNFGTYKFGTVAARDKLEQLIGALYDGNLTGAEATHDEPFRLVGIDDAVYFRPFSNAVARKTLRIPGAAFDFQPSYTFTGAPAFSVLPVGPIANDVANSVQLGHNSHVFFRARVQSDDREDLVAHLLRETSGSWPGEDAFGFPIHPQTWTNRTSGGAGDGLAERCALDGTDPHRVFTEACPLIPGYGQRQADNPYAQFEVLEAYLGHNIAVTSWMFGAENPHFAGRVASWEIVVVDPAFPGAGEELLADIGRPVQAMPMPLTALSPIAISTAPQGVSLSAFETADDVAGRLVNRPVAVNSVTVHMQLMPPTTSNVTSYLSHLTVVLDHQGVTRVLTAPIVDGNTVTWTSATDAALRDFAGTSGAGVWTIAARDAAGSAPGGWLSAATVLIN